MAILYIKFTGVSIYLSIRAVFRHCPDLCFFVFFLDGFCFLCQLNCPDLCFFFFFFLVDGFCFLCQLNYLDLYVCVCVCVFFFWLMGFVFCVS
jgi:hypothetical protein